MCAGSTSRRRTDASGPVFSWNHERRTDGHRPAEGEREEEEEVEEEEEEEEEEDEEEKEDEDEWGVSAK